MQAKLKFRNHLCRDNISPSFNARVAQVCLFIHTRSKNNPVFAMAALPTVKAIVDTLTKVGVLKSADTVERTAAEATHASTHTYNVQSGLIGALPGSKIEWTKGEEPLPRYQPSPFYKAMSYTLLSYMSNATSLTDENQAMFLGTLKQAGVPAGKLYPAEVTNYQTFLKADAIQKINHPTYSIAGDSYFEYLASYVQDQVSA